MLREGRGTNKDWPQAAYWLACADVLGEPRAMKDLPPLLRQLSPEQRKKFNARLVKAPLPPRVQPAKLAPVTAESPQSTQSTQSHSARRSGDAPCYIRGASGERRRAVRTGL